ncbi:MAG: sugar-binding protein [Bacteroidota bacterium]
MKRIFDSILFLTFFIFQHQHLYGQSVYTIKKNPFNAITINGKGDATAWKSANTLTHFIYPWEKTEAPATFFAALYDANWLYLLYKVNDDSVITFSNTTEKREIGRSDRVEIFFKVDDKMTPYYCLEMDATGRIFDYRADYYRQMHYEWRWPTNQLTVKTSKTKDGYTLEAAISIPSLKTLGLLKDNILQAGIFRAECTGIENGKPLLKWISWIDPKSAGPDFHIPAAFGILKLE